MDPSHLPKRRRGGSTSARVLLALDPRDSFGNGNAPACSDDGERKIVELGERKRSAAISILEKSGMLLEGDATFATQALTAPSTPRGTYNLLSLSDFSIFNLPNGFTMSSGGAARWSHRPTGCKALNSLLYTPMTGEGLPAGRVIELFGNPGSDRTQVVMSCVAACAVSEIPVMVIDTCNGIQPSSIAAAIARALHNAFPEPTAQQKQAIREQYEPAMDRVGVERCFSLFTLLDVLAEILRRGGREAGAGGSQVGLLAIDCLHSVISPTLGSCFNPTSTSSTSSTSSFYSPLSPRELVNSVLLHLKAISEARELYVGLCFVQNNQSTELVLVVPRRGLWHRLGLRAYPNGAKDVNRCATPPSVGRQLVISLDMTTARRRRSPCDVATQSLFLLARVIVFLCVCPKPPTRRRGVLLLECLCTHLR